MQLHNGPRVPLAKSFNLTVFGVKERVEATAGDKYMRVLFSQLLGFYGTFRRLLIVGQGIVAQFFHHRGIKLNLSRRGAETGLLIFSIFPFFRFPPAYLDKFFKGQSHGF